MARTLTPLRSPYVVAGMEWLPSFVPCISREVPQPLQQSWRRFNLRAIHDGCGGAACSETFCSEVSPCLAQSHRRRPGQPRHTGASDMCSLIFYGIGISGRCRGKSCDARKAGSGMRRLQGFPCQRWTSNLQPVTSSHSERSPIQGATPECKTWHGHGFQQSYDFILQPGERVKSK